MEEKDRRPATGNRNAREIGMRDTGCEGRQGRPAGDQMRKVISASRRTDLVAHYPELLCQRLEQVGWERIHSVAVWTKDPRNLLEHDPLRQSLSRVPQVVVHWTVTGLGGTFLEPRIRPADEQFGMLERLVDFLGTPARIWWRYDPLVAADWKGRQASNLEPDRFERLAERFSAAGVSRVYTSVMTVYPKVKRRLERLGIELRLPADQESRALIGELSERAGRLGMTLLTCCQPGFSSRGCIDGKALAGLHPGGEACSTRRAGGQRPACGCTESYDVGYYLGCPGGCVYCYARPV